MNIDAALFPTENKFGYSLCLRDERGQMIQACITWMARSRTPTEAEGYGTILEQSSHSDQNVLELARELS